MHKIIHYLNMPIKINIGAKFHEIRKERNMDQASFAELLSMTQSTYSRLERGETIPTIEQLAKYCELLNINLSDFLPDTITFNSKNNGHVGIVYGNYNNYANIDERIQILEKENEQQKQRIVYLEDKNRMLIEENTFLKTLLENKQL